LSDKVGNITYIRERNISMEHKKFQQTSTTEAKKSKRGLILAIVVLIIILLSLWLTVFFISQRTSFLGRASSPSLSSGEVELDNSYIFASPLSAKADGKEKIRITVFILDSQGRGVYGQPVFLGEDERLNIKEVQAITDNIGRAMFDVSSFTVTDYFVEASVNNQVLPQRVKVSFR